MNDNKKHSNPNLDRGMSHIQSNRSVDQYALDSVGYQGDAASKYMGS